MLLRPTKGPACLAYGSRSIRIVRYRVLGRGARCRDGGVGPGGRAGGGHAWDVARLLPHRDHTYIAARVEELARYQLLDPYQVVEIETEAELTGLLAQGSTRGQA